MTDKSSSARERRLAHRLALGLVNMCVHDSQLDAPLSCNFSNAAHAKGDVVVVSRCKAIVWPQVSSIPDAEMMASILKLASRIFSYLSFPEDLICL